MDSAVRELPLFPLDVVLFPHMLVPLHIFEERYRIMVSRCWEADEPFGIVLAIGASEGEARSVVTAPVGCTARIRKLDKLPDGRMNIQVLGESRFRILDSHESEPYRTGIVAPLEDAPCDPEPLADLIQESQELLREYLVLQMARMGQSVTGFELPDDPTILSFTAACVLPIDILEKQSLLEETEPGVRLSRTRSLLDKAVQELRTAGPATPTVFAPMDIARFEAYLCWN